MGIHFIYAVQRGAWLTLLALLLSLPAANGLFAQSTTAPPQTQPGESSGIVRPGDVMRLKVWREPDMSRDASVNEAGMPTLPRLAAVQVSNLSADSIQRFLVNTYSRYLRDP